MKITDVPMSQMQKVARRRASRARSQDTEQLVEAINSLAAGTAKAIELDATDDPKKVRAKVTYAARVAGKKVRVVIEGHRVLFARARARRT